MSFTYALPFFVSRRTTLCHGLRWVADACVCRTTDPQLCLEEASPDSGHTCGGCLQQWHVVLVQLQQHEGTPGLEERKLHLTSQHSRRHPSVHLHAHGRQAVHTKIHDPIAAISIGCVTVLVLSPRELEFNRRLTIQPCSLCSVPGVSQELSLSVSPDGPL